MMKRTKGRITKTITTMAMKRLFLAVALAMAAALQVQAQVNPKAGYIITNANDTVYGTVDYRSDVRNAETCSFKADGAAQYTDYGPTDIKGYRLTDDGIYYVSRTFPVDGVNKTFFAEYLLQGGMSLYFHREGTEDLYYFVDEEGQIAVMKELEGLTGSGHHNARIKRETYQDVFNLFKKSGKAQTDLWALHELSPKQLTRITREYNEAFCTEYGDCVEFQYKPASARSVIPRLRLQVGANVGSLKANRYQYVTNLKYNAVMPQLGVGCDFLLPRVSKNLSLQAMLLAGYWSATGTASKEQHVVDPDYDLSFINVELQIGAAYRFSEEAKVTPVVRGGLFVNQKFTSDGLVADFYNGESSAMGFRFGAYVGIGVDVPVGTHCLRIEADYLTPELNSQKKGDATIDKTSAIELNVSFLF